MKSCIYVLPYSKVYIIVLIINILEEIIYFYVGKYPPLG